MQDVFDEVKKEEPLYDIETFFMRDNDISDSDDISDADREAIMDLINRNTFIADAKKFVEDMQASQIEIVDTPTKQKLEKRKGNSIENDQNVEGAPSENCLMSKVKVKNKSLSKVRKNRWRIRKTYKEGHNYSDH